jgi:hypothetical protein
MLKKQLDKDQEQGTPPDSFMGIDLPDNIRLSESVKLDPKPINLGNEEQIPIPDVKENNTENKDNVVIKEDINTKINKNSDNKDAKETKLSVFDDNAKLSFLNEMFKGEYKSVEDAVTEFSNIRTSVPDYEKQIQELKTKAETAINPFKENKELAIAHNFMKETHSDLQTYLKVKNIDLENINHLEILVEDFMLRNKGQNRNDVKEMFEEQYKITPESFDDYDSDDDDSKLSIEKKIARNKLRLINDTSPLLEKYKELKGKMVVPDYEGEAATKLQEKQAKEAASKEAWNKVVPDMIKSFAKYQDFVKGEDTPFVELEVTDEQREIVYDTINKYLDGRSLGDVTEKEVKNLGYTIHNIYSDMFKTEIYNEIRQKAITETTNSLNKRYGIDPSQLRKNDNSEINNSELSEHKQYNSNQDKKILSQLMGI